MKGLTELISVTKTKTGSWAKLLGTAETVTLLNKCGRRRKRGSREIGLGAGSRQLCKGKSEGAMKRREEKTECRILATGTSGEQE